MKKNGLLILALLLASNLALAENFATPSIPQTTRTKVTATEKNSGKKLWNATQTRELINDNGKIFIRIVEEGKGNYNGSKVPLEWKFEGYYYTQPNLHPYYSSHKVFSEAGALQLAENLVYDQGAKKVLYSRQDNGKLSNKTLMFYEDLIDNYLLATAMISYPFKEKRNFKFHQITEDQSIYLATISYKGKEKVTVPAGTFDCHKVELTVDLGPLGFVGAFLPKLYFWFADTDSPFFVKYEGLESGLGTPYVIIELNETKETP
jgi:hypothetical protein